MVFEISERTERERERERERETDRQTDRPTIIATLRFATAEIYDTIRYHTRCCFYVRSKADTSQLNLPHGTDS